MNYYISDTHFGHKNVIRYDNRPFDSIEEMDEAMIQLWNETVNDADAVYILGDFSWYKEDKTALILGKLKGHKILIKGNHDRVSSKVARYFDRVCVMQKSKITVEKLLCRTIQCRSGMVNIEIRYTCMVMYIIQVNIITVLA